MDGCRFVGDRPDIFLPCKLETDDGSDSDEYGCSSVVSMDSEETAAEDGHATNAFDDSPSTYWHTQWQGEQPPPPHEIVIDLGGRYTHDEHAPHAPPGRHPVRHGQGLRVLRERRDE